jgi:hypothetical protein
MPRRGSTSSASTDADDIGWYEAEGMPYGGLHRGGAASFIDTVKFAEVVPAAVATAG